MNIALPLGYFRNLAREIGFEPTIDVIHLFAVSLFSISYVYIISKILLKINQSGKSAIIFSRSSFSYAQFASS